jgi:hypothetical protein
MSGNVRLTAGPKGHPPSSFGSLRCPQLSALCNRIDVSKAMAQGQYDLRLLMGRSACFGNAHKADRSQSHIALSPVQPIPENPTLCPARAHPEIKTRTIAIEAGLARLCDRDRRQPMRLPCHGWPDLNSILCTIHLQAVVDGRKRKVLKVSGHKT